MKTFTIDAENNITVHASKKAAKETGASVFASEAELGELIGSDGKRLVEIWNGLAGISPVKKVRDSKTGVARVWKQIQNLGERTSAAPETDVPEPQPEAPAELPATPFDDAHPSPAPAAAQPQASTETAASQEVAPPATAEPVADAGAQSADVAPAEAQPTKKVSRVKKAPKAPKAARPAKTESGPREGSKTAQVVEMMKRPDGATISEIMTTMGWQKRTVRGFMAGAMKKAGYTVESFKPEGGERTYRINK